MACLLRITTACILLSSVCATDRNSFETGTQTIRSIIHDIRTWQDEHKRGDKDAERPFVTVTYAQSIDGKIALLVDSNQDDGDDFRPEHSSSPSSSTSSNFAMSDPESLRMTHALRSIHDAILVGGSTLSVDNPRLNNRLWPDDSGDYSRRQVQPRPVVLDTHLKHMKKLGSACRATNIIACCSTEAAATANAEELPESVELLPCSLDPKTGRIDLALLLWLLKDKYGIESVMVEGGASVLSAFYCQQHELVDCLCITISPKLLLWRGLSSINSTPFADNGDDYVNANFILDKEDFVSSKFLLLGSDSIFLGKLQQHFTSLQNDKKWKDN